MKQIVLLFFALYSVQPFLKRAAFFKEILIDRGRIENPQRTILYYQGV